MLKNVGPAGERIADFIHFMGTEQNIQAQDIHIVGHSLGAHMAGAAGMFTQEKYGKTVGRSIIYTNHASKVNQYRPRSKFINALYQL